MFPWPFVLIADASDAKKKRNTDRILKNLSEYLFFECVYIYKYLIDFFYLLFYLFISSLGSSSS